jgi:hypothetical protein
MMCRCGHGREFHEHNRPGSDCSACDGEWVCVRFRRRWWGRTGYWAFRRGGVVLGEVVAEAIEFVEGLGR